MDTLTQKQSKAVSQHDNAEALESYFLNDYYYNNQLDIDEVISNFEEAYQGEFEGQTDDEILSDFVQSAELIDLSEYPDWIQCNFDFEKYARDLRLGGDYFVLKNYVFANN